MAAAWPVGPRAGMPRGGVGRVRVPTTLPTEPPGEGGEGGGSVAVGRSLCLPCWGLDSPSPCPAKSQASSHLSSAWGRPPLLLAPLCLGRGALCLWPCLVHRGPCRESACVCSSAEPWEEQERAMSTGLPGRGSRPGGSTQDKPRAGEGHPRDGGAGASAMPCAPGAPSQGPAVQCPSCGLLWGHRCPHASPQDVSFGSSVVFLSVRFRQY